MASEKRAVRAGKKIDEVIRARAGRGNILRASGGTGNISRIRFFHIVENGRMMSLHGRPMQREEDIDSFLPSS